MPVESEEFDELGGQLAAAVRRLGVSARGFVTMRLAPWGLTRFLGAVLREVSRSQPCTQVHLADTCGVEQPAITTAIDKLSRLGLVHRDRSASDGRVWLIRLTPEGEALMPHVEGVWRELAERLTAGLDEASVRQWVDHMRAADTRLRAGPSASDLRRG